MQRIRFCYHVPNKSNLFFLGDSIIRIGLVLFVIIFFTYYNILQPVYITDSAIKELRNMFYFLYKLQASIFIVQNRQKKKFAFNKQEQCIQRMYRLPFNLCVHICRCNWCWCWCCYKCIYTYHFERHQELVAKKWQPLCWNEIVLHFLISSHSLLAISYL